MPKHSRPKAKAKKSRPETLRPRVEAHLGVPMNATHSVSHPIRAAQRVNLLRALDRWAEAAGAEGQPIGFSATERYFVDSLVRGLTADCLIPSPVERVQLPSGPAGEVLDGLQSGLHLLRRGGTPVVVAVSPPRFSHERPTLEVVAPDRATAGATLAALLDEAQRHNVYKGQTITLEIDDYERNVQISFSPVRPVGRDAIVLPEELLTVVERNVLGMLRHSEALRASGRSLRRGLLFHGPPGTGKTLLVRYLCGACPDHTVVLLPGVTQGLAREACRVARLLAPSIVVLEDVDLVAENRDTNRCAGILHDLLNEMDGLGPRDEVTFLLTTNRPEILEPALSARPGRVDQAIAFPLPDGDCRRRLFGVYGHGLETGGLDLARWVDRTAGVSPAFIEELLRKAALLAAERGESAPLRLTDVDVDGALRELVYFGGELTRRLLGYKNGE